MADRTTQNIPGKAATQQSINSKCWYEGTSTRRKEHDIDTTVVLAHLQFDSDDNDDSNKNGEIRDDGDGDSKINNKLCCGLC